MSKHLHRDLELLKRQILTMGTQVEEALRDSLVALIDRDEQLAESVIRGDDAIDQAELENHREFRIGEHVLMLIVTERE